MENMNDSDMERTALEFSLNTAVWLTGALIVPTCSPSDERANDESLEVVR